MRPRPGSASKSSCLGEQMVHEVTGDGACARFVFGPTGGRGAVVPRLARRCTKPSCTGLRGRPRLGPADGALRVAHDRPRCSSFELNGVPFEMRSALVQGFSAGTLYGALTRAEAEAEVAGPPSRLGLNTLRLHIKAFDPVYLDVCDERGCSSTATYPVAEPIAHDELGWDGGAHRTMRGRGGRAGEARPGPPEHRFVVGDERARWRGSCPSAGGRAMRVSPGGSTRIRGADPTRPVIENDWMEPDPELRVREPHTDGALVRAARARATWPSWRRGWPPGAEAAALC